jgi:hypothetical protein
VAGPPDSWIAVHATAGGFEVRRWAGADSTQVTTWSRQGAESRGIDATDVALGGSGGIAIVGTCCEPVSGTIFVADTSGEALESIDQGLRVDARGNGDLVARVDAFGHVGVRPAFPGDARQYLGEPVGALDVAVMPDGSVGVLVNPVHIANPDPGPDAPALLHLTPDGSDWATRRIELEHDYCSVVGLAGGRVGLVRAPADWIPVADPCVASRIEILNISDGATDTVDLAAPAVHLSADDSGTYVLATGVDGNLTWLTLDGRGGPLLDGGDVRAADW